MMMDGKGCAMIAGALSLIGLLIGLLLNWTGLAPWWAPLAGAALPIGLGALFVVYLVAAWMKDGSH